MVVWCFVPCTLNSHVQFNIIMCLNHSELVSKKEQEKNKHIEQKHQNNGKSVYIPSSWAGTEKGNVLPLPIHTSLHIRCMLKGSSSTQDSTLGTVSLRHQAPKQAGWLWLLGMKKSSAIKLQVATRLQKSLPQPQPSYGTFLVISLGWNRDEPWARPISGSQGFGPKIFLSITRSSSKSGCLGFKSASKATLPHCYWMITKPSRPQLPQNNVFSTQSWVRWQYQSINHFDGPNDTVYLSWCPARSIRSWRTTHSCQATSTVKAVSPPSIRFLRTATISICVCNYYVYAAYNYMCASHI